MVPTILAVAAAAYCIKRAETAIRQGNDVVALLLCLFAATLVVGGMNIDASFVREIGALVP